MDIDVKKLKSHSVKQGSLTEFITIEDVERHHKKFGHLFYVTFENKKTVRGNHYHKKHHEYYIVLSGKVKVLLLDLETKRKKSITLDSKDGFRRLRIGPNIAHASFSISPKSTLLAYYGDPHDQKKIDTFQYDLIKK